MGRLLSCVSKEKSDTTTENKPKGGSTLENKQNFGVKTQII